MEEIIKHINDTNASYRALGAGDAKNTDLFLDNEHYELFRDSGDQIKVRFSKENLAKAILFIASILPRKYDNSAIHKTISYSQAFVLDQLAFLNGFFTVDGVSVTERTQVWNARKDVLKKNGEIDSRFYFNGLLEDVTYTNYLGEEKVAKFTIRNYLAGGYSDIHFKKTDIAGLFDVIITNTTESRAEEDGNIDIIDFSDFPLQQIFYGAPGTGKSNTIKCEVEDKERIHFRTTFHPDSDYSTFVGCYKPTKEPKRALKKQIILDYDSLVDKFKEYLSAQPSNITKACALFGNDYHDSIVSMQDSGHTITALVADAYKTGSTYDSVLRAGMSIFESSQHEPSESSSITYEFVPQAFTKAYCEAWNNYNPEGESEPVFLVIEEINRGNCAQIFGDIFQLLDRKDNGFSDYPIDADEDLKAFLENGAKKDGSQWLTNKDGIANGKLCLPPNLYIWATMNTSDQSLFPIDSAFKRRWDWEYVPIKRADKEPEKKWKIKVSHDKKTYWCYWWEFLEAINHQIEETTHSEDKQLGYFFAKPKAGENFISTDTFVNKVIFYLWNDVFKDEDSAVFQYDNDKVEDVSINRSGTIYFRHFMENKDEMIHYFINQLFAMGKDNTPVVPIDYLKNDADSKVIEHLPKMRVSEEEAPAPEEKSEEKTDDSDSK